MINKALILLLFEKCKDIVRRDVFHGQPALESQAGVMQELVEGIAVGMKLAGGIFHRHILYSQEDQSFPLPVGQLDRRLHEAAKLGFASAIIPGVLGRGLVRPPDGLQIVRASTIGEAIDRALAS